LKISKFQVGTLFVQPTAVVPDQHQQKLGHQCIKRCPIAGRLVLIQRTRLLGHLHKRAGPTNWIHIREVQQFRHTQRLVDRRRVMNRNDVNGIARIRVCRMHNADSNAINLASYRFSNNVLDPGLWSFPTGATIAVGERLLIWADGETNETAVGNIHAGFRLNSASGTVVLARQHLGEAIVVDYLHYGEVGADASYGTYPEGERHSRQIFPTPTPGTANSQAAGPIQVFINEWMPDNETTVPDPTDGNFEDWFELYNASLASLDLGGYFLTDELTQTNTFAVPGNTIIPGQGFLLVWADQDVAVNGSGTDLHVNFQLNNAGEEIGLYAPDGTLVDAVHFGPLGDDQSEGRWPDGQPTILPMSPPTPKDSNSVFIVIGVNDNAP